ncbi:MAG: aromatic amino acid ammonia-lyase, partial [Pseudomonadota bacterium]|nr:aromatic amino acid ammonia-lyase [Pseudomonadota bacterium]
MMRLLIVLLLSLTMHSLSAATTPLSLSGHHLTVRDVIDVARHNKSVSITTASKQTVEQSHQLLLAAARADLAIYGLTRGVGLNKDKKIFEGKQQLSPEMIRLSEQYNRRALYATSAGVGENTSTELVRATMLIRLNTLLLGYAGVQPQVVDLYAAFLNKQITPIIPARGSVGQADITILSHIGLAMMGEGEVMYQGERISAASALHLARLKPLRPCAKDALSIMSSNAYATAIGVLAIDDLQKLLKVSYVIFALNMEGYNANIEVFLPTVHQVRPYPYQINAAQTILMNLKNSYLWSPSANRALQEPLSYKTAAQNFAIVAEAVDEVQEKLSMQMNSSDDNPAVVLTNDISALSKTASKYVVDDGRYRGVILPTANYSPITWVVSLEKLTNALSHFSHATT